MWGVRRRYGVSGKLLAVGMLTYSGAFAAQSGLAWLIGGPLFASPLFGAMLLGIIIGFTDSGARFWGYHKVAKGVVYRSQAVMVGIGHALPFMVVNGVLIALTLLNVVEEEGTTADVWAGLIMQPAQLMLHICLSWMVLQTFLRNELGWVFQAVLLAGIAFSTDAFITNGVEEPAALLMVWWTMIGGISLLACWRINPPPEFIQQ